VIPTSNRAGSVPVPASVGAGAHRSAVRCCPAGASQGSEAPK
jgi:hypothetical protein